MRYQRGGCCLRGFLSSVKLSVAAVSFPCLACFGLEHGPTKRGAAVRVCSNSFSCVAATLSCSFVEPWTGHLLRSSPYLAWACRVLPVSMLDWAYMHWHTCSHGVVIYIEDDDGNVGRQEQNGCATALCMNNHCAYSLVQTMLLLIFSQIR